MKLLGDHSDSTKLDPESFINAIKRSRVIPTIVFDVERGGSLDQKLGIQAVRSLAKMLSPYCRCIIILSEANAVLEFGRDKFREIFIYVDELTEAQARELMQRLHVTLSDSDLRYVFDNIGTSPAMLHQLAAVVPTRVTLKHYVDDVLEQARQELVAFPHKAILKALKVNPRGVSPEYFENKEHKGVDLSNPEDVGLSMKKSDAIVYRLELRVYTLLSTAHRTALKSYDPIVLS